MIKKLKKIIKILINHDERKKKKNPNERLQFQRIQPWIKDNGDETLRLNYNLDEHSVVFDLGGYKGEFASSIYCKYSSYIYIFEPVSAFYQVIKTKFSNTSKVCVFNYGLSNKSQNIKISLTDNASSAFIDAPLFENISLISIVDFIQTNEIKKVDLIKINIEGGEFDVLEALIENNLISIFLNIQVQFHDFIIENAKERMNKIQLELSKTHQLTYQYEFVWENWKLK